MMDKLSTLRKNRKFYLLLCGFMLLSLSMKVQVANSVNVTGITIQSFTKIDFQNDGCWISSVGSGTIQYTNFCLTNSVVVLTLLDGITQKTFLVAPQGKLIFLGGSVVHIIKEFP